MRFKARQILGNVSLANFVIGGARKRMSYLAGVQESEACNLSKTVSKSSIRDAQQDIHLRGHLVDVHIIENDGRVVTASVKMVSFHGKQQITPISAYSSRVHRLRVLAQDSITLLPVADEPVKLILAGAG